MFKPVIIGGQDISSLRAVFDHDNRRIIVPTNRQLIYYNIQSGNQDAVSNIPPGRLQVNEIIVAYDRIDTSLYLFTNYGKVFIWSLESRDWTNELSLPIKTGMECLVSCKMLSKRQYFYTALDNATKKVSLYQATSRSERERPKQSELISEITRGDVTSFDIGFCSPEEDLDTANKVTKENISKQRILTFVKDNRLYFQRISIGEKFHLQLTHQTSDLRFECVRANGKLPLIAAGDCKGRIFLYSGDIGAEKVDLNRTKLHWHRASVSDLCFSSTGSTLYSCGSESGCLVIWDLAANTIGRKNVISSLGMPIRHINCSQDMSYIVLSFEDNEIKFMDTDNFTISMRTLTRRTYDIYLKNDFKVLRFGQDKPEHADDQNGKLNKSAPCSIGMLWHPKSDSIVTNCKTGRLQFFSTKQRATTEILDCLKTDILSLDSEARVLPSEITRAALSLDGDWLAFYETRQSTDGIFPEVRLHIWQRSSTFSKWFWVQTADRLHSSINIVDLKFSPDGRYLVSVCEDGTFHVLHRVNLDAKSTNKQMYAKGYFGNVPSGLPSLAAFSQDSSVLAITLKNDSTLIWLIVDPYELKYECQLNQQDSNDIDQLTQSGYPDENSQNIDRLNPVLGLHFGRHEPSKSIAPLCEVRSRHIRIWNILCAQLNSEEMMEYSAADGCRNIVDDDNHTTNNDEFIATAFEQCLGSEQGLEHFAVSTRRNYVHLFELKINQDSRKLQPLISIDGTLSQVDNLTIPRQFAHMCFVSNPINDIDEKSHPDPLVIKLINRLCLMTNEQELVSFTDRLTVDRELAINNCNDVKTYELSDVQEYFAKSKTSYKDEICDISTETGDRTLAITTKQRRIRQRLEVQRMLKDLFERIPTHNLPRMDLLGPMILDKLIIE